jgi:hypothetical protein
MRTAPASTAALTDAIGIVAVDMKKGWGEFARASPVTDHHHRVADPYYGRSSCGHFGIRVEYRLEEADTPATSGVNIRGMTVGQPFGCRRFAFEAPSDIWRALVPPNAACGPRRCASRLPISSATVVVLQHFTAQEAALVLPGRQASAQLRVGSRTAVVHSYELVRQGNAERVHIDALGSAWTLELRLELQRCRPNVAVEEEQSRLEIDLGKADSASSGLHGWM